MAAFGIAPAREKTDIVHLHNGDRLTGEVKSLRQSLLTLKTDALDTVRIEWEDVADLRSHHAFEIEVIDGTRHYGSLGEPAAPGQLLVLGAEATTPLVLSDVVRITPIEATFWSRLDGSLSLGFNTTKSSGVAQLNFAASSAYRSRRFLAEITASSIVTSQETLETTRRNDLGLHYQRYYRRRVFSDWAATLEQNEELGIDLRLLGSAGVGRNLVQTNNAILATLGGLAVNRERLTNDEPSENNIEGLLAIGFSMFRYDQPKTNISTHFAFYPSLTVSDRHRAELDADIRRELVKDFFVELSGYYSYDSRPLAEDVSQDDYGIVFSLGWTY